MPPGSPDGIGPDYIGVLDRKVGIKARGLAGFKARPCGSAGEGELEPRKGPEPLDDVKRLWEVIGG